MVARSTLIPPPPADPDKAPIENLLEVTELAVLGPNIFTNTRKPWHPPGARGIYGGAVIAMSLAAGQRTVPDDFTAHSCHCYFLTAGSGELPILFHVELVRDGRSFATRTVQARQRGRSIFTTTISFVRERSGGSSSSSPSTESPPSDSSSSSSELSTPPSSSSAFPNNQVRHAVQMPLGPDGEPLRPPPDDFAGEPGAPASRGPFQDYRIEVLNRDSPDPQAKKTRQWVRARGRIAGGRQAHLNALAYMSDSYFIGTISRIHRLWRWPFAPGDVAGMAPSVRDHFARLNDWEGFGADLSALGDRPSVGMMVSLDHTIYFHEPAKVAADDWMFTEMESPWAGDGRGVVIQRIFHKDGTLLATCVQEGVVRLKEEPAASEGKGRDSKI